MINNYKRLEIKLMGTVFVVPIIMLCIVLIVGFLSINSDNAEYIIYSTMENLIPLFAGWWGIFCMYELLEAEGGEIMRTYGLSFFSLGIKKNLYYFCSYLVMSMVASTIVMQIVMQHIFIDMLVQIAFQALYFSAFAFAIMTLVRNSGWSLFVLMAYFIIAFFTNGEGLWIFNIYLFKQGFSFDSSLLFICLKCFGFAILFYITGNRLIKRN